VHDDSGGLDGYVSLEVAPALAHDTEGTIQAARHFHELVDEPNLYVKIPATSEGVPAIREMIAEGKSINITLLFSLERYAQVIEAYLGGLEDRRAAGTEDLSPVHSAASFFVSRVDTEVDRRLDALAEAAPNGPEALKPHAATPAFQFIRALAIEAYYSDFMAPGATGPSAYEEIDFHSPLAMRIKKDWSYLGVQA